MKKTIKTPIQIILAATLLFTACKKKEETTNSNSTPAIAAPAAVKTMTSSVNNISWQANSGAFSFASTNIMYNFGGQTNFYPNPNTGISFNLPKPISVGNYTFSNTGSVQAYYKDSSGVFYTSNVGNINITQIDTTSPANGTVTKLKATFNFTTGIVSNKSYTINSGVIDYNK